MSKEVTSVRVQHRGMSTQEWESSGDILLAREIGIDTTTGYPKVGDGKNKFKDLKDLRGERGEKGEPGDAGPQGPSGPTGETGPRGEQGVSVKSASVDSEGYLTVLLDNGQSFKSKTSLKGPQGEKGPKGADGKMTFEQLTPEQKQSLKGDAGPKGDKGDAGPKGNDGAPGSSVTVTKIEEETTGSTLGSWFGKGAKATKVTFSNGKSITLPHGKDASLPSDLVRQSDLAGYVKKGESEIPDLQKIARAMGQVVDSKLSSYVSNGQLSGYVRLAEIQAKLDNIGKIKDIKTGQFLDVLIVDRGQVPTNTQGKLVFERLTRGK